MGNLGAIMSKSSIQSQALQPGDGHGVGARSPKGRGAGERILATATESFARFGYNGVSTEM